MATSDIKHERRLTRMLSKYGKLKTNCDDKTIDSISQCVEYKKKSSLPDDNSGSDQVDMPISLRRSVSYENDNSPTTDTNSKIFLDYFPPIKYDFFEEDKLPNEQPFIFLNSFNEKKTPLLPFNFYHRPDNNSFWWKWTRFKCFKQLTDQKHESHRAVATTLLMLVQGFILLILLTTYGTSYFNLPNFNKNVTDVVWHQTNSYQIITYSEPSNIWLGPSPAILIRAGAIFSPCMKNQIDMSDANMHDRRKEDQTGCCIRLDGVGCVQTPENECSKRTSMWMKFADRPGPVCGLDPKYCLDKKKKWPEQISQWPICHRTNLTAVSLSVDSYMKCQVSARPCCLGILGQCMLLSEKHCHFMKGKYHPRASLCSQVNCWNGICGITTFEQSPNQIYRLLLSLFMHAGLIQFILTIAIQYLYMRVVEQTYGTRRTFILYFVSGLGGNLASALFLPTTPEIGPSGALFGLFSVLIYEIWNNRRRLVNPYIAIFKVASFLIFVFFIGLLFPWVNNFTNLFGLLYGLITLFLIFPDSNGKSRICTRSFYISLILLSLITGPLIYLFYNSHLVQPLLPLFQKFNCLNITPTWCPNMDIRYHKLEALN